MAATNFVCLIRLQNQNAFFFLLFSIFEPKFRIMKKLGLFVLFTMALSSNSWSQSKSVHFYDAKVESQPEHLLSFTNEEYVVLVGKNEVKKDLFMYNVSWVNIRNNETGSQQIRCRDRMNPTLFGFHYNRDGFAFFEEVTNEKEKLSTLLLHELHLQKGVISNRLIHSEPLDYVNKKSYFAGTTHGKFSAIYALVQFKDGTNSSKTYSLNYEYKVIDVKTTPIKDGLDLEFKTIAQLSESGSLLTVVQTKNDKEANKLMFQYGNVLEAGGDGFNEFRSLFNEKNKVIHDFKVYVNEESIIEFVGLYNFKSDKGMTTRMVVRYFHPLKERFLVDKDFDMNAPQDLTLHSLLPMDNDFFVVVTKTNNAEKKSAQKDTKQALSLSPAERLKGAESKGEVGLLVNYIHIEKGIVWKESLKNEISLSRPELAEMNPKVFDYYFWSDGQFLYALHHFVPEKKSSVSSDIKSSTLSDGMELGVLMMDLNTGQSRVKLIDVDERVKKYALLPSYSALTTMKFLTTIIQIDKKTFYPIQLFSFL